MRSELLFLVKNKSWKKTKKEHRGERKEILRKIAAPRAHEVKHAVVSILKQLTTHNVTQEHEEVAVLQKGDTFGEQALLHNKPRAATIQCLEPCFFAVLSKSDYEKGVGRI